MSKSDLIILREYIMEVSVWLDGAHERKVLEALDISDEEWSAILRRLDQETI